MTGRRSTTKPHGITVLAKTISTRRAPIALVTACGVDRGGDHLRLRRRHALGNEIGSRPPRRDAATAWRSRSHRLPPGVGRPFTITLAKP